MKSKLNMESLTKQELLMLFSILEGELEARDLVIDALKAQRKDFFVRERYGRYDLSDPFLALQRDGEAVGAHRSNDRPAASNPLVVLKLVVGHCRRMQEKTLAQLAAAESRHRMVIMDLEEEKRKHAEDTAEGDDVTYILEKERERLQQQLDFERSQVRRLEKEQRRAAEQLEEERAQHKQLSCALAKECKWASARALEEGHRLTEAGRKLDKEREACQALKEELEEERRRALRMEARVEEQLAEFDTEREQLRSRLRKEEAHCARLQQQVEELQRKLSVVSVVEDVQEDCEQWATKVPLGKKTAETKLEHNKEESRQATAETKVNGHHFATEADEGLIGGSPSGNPAGHQTLTSSPCASPLLTKRQIAPAVCKSSYQAGINQRFQAARHRFQATPPDLETAQALSPCTSPPPPAESSKQMARSTVTQVLSRFTTTQQAPNPSPFGTDYRCLTAPLSPVAARAAAAAAGPPQGVRSPTIPRADRGNPPPIPPKKPSLGQAPPSPAAVPRSGGHLNDGPRSGSCGLTSGQDAVKELDVVLSSN